jgi:hypothetical protein
MLSNDERLRELGSNKCFMLAWIWFGFQSVNAQLPDATVAYEGPPDAVERAGVFVLSGTIVAGTAFGGQHELFTRAMVKVSVSAAMHLVNGRDSLVNASILNTLCHASNSVILVALV